MSVTYEKPLAGLTILITRPQHQATALCKLITHAGGNAIALPTIAIESLTNQPNFQYISNKINAYDIAIFVSANAVHSMMSYWPASFTSPVVAIGPGTAAALTAHHIAIHAIPQHFSSEGILNLPLLQQVQHKRIVIFCGENSRPFLRETLIKRGAVVDEAACYRRYSPVIHEEKRQWLIQQPINYIVSTSQESLKNLHLLFQNSSEWLYQIPLLVISPPMALLAQQLGFRQPVIIADDATDGAIVLALLEHIGKPFPLLVETTVQ